MPTLYVLAFIAVLLLVAWVTDRRSARVRRGLVRPASLGYHGRTADYYEPHSRIERTAPGTTSQPQAWREEGAHGG